MLKSSNLRKLLIVGALPFIAPNISLSAEEANKNSIETIQDAEKLWDDATVSGKYGGGTNYLPENQGLSTTALDFGSFVTDLAVQIVEESTENNEDPNTLTLENMGNIINGVSGGNNSTTKSDGEIPEVDQSSSEKGSEPTHSF